MYNALVKDMYTKYALNRFTGIDIKYRGINGRPYEKDNLVVKLLTVDDDVPKKDNKEYVKEEDYYYVHITKIIPKIRKDNRNHTDTETSSNKLIVTMFCQK